jgi:predicted DNA-binding transcriptional regulator AlpA
MRSTSPTITRPRRRTSTAPADPPGIVTHAAHLQSAGPGSGGDDRSTHRSVIPTALAGFDSLPDCAHVRLPVVAALFACSTATVWRRCKTGALPPPVKFGGTTAWNVGSLRAVLAGE